MPRYQQANTFDLVRSVKNLQSSVSKLQVLQPGLVRKSLNQVQASLSTNGYFWGGDVTGWAATNGTFVVASDAPSPPYPYTGLYVNNGSAAGYLGLSLTPFLATPLQQYQAIAYVNSTASVVQIGFNWLDASNSPLVGPTNTSVTVTPNTWTQISTALTAPTGTASAYPVVGSPTADSAATYVTGIITQTSSPGPGVWQDMRPLSNAFVGTNAGEYPPQYRLTGDGGVEIAGYIKTPPTTGNYNSVVFATLPAAYRPGSNAGHRWLVSGPADGSATPTCTINVSGQLVLNFLPTSLAQTLVCIAGRYPLDSSGLILA